MLYHIASEVFQDNGGCVVGIFCRDRLVEIIGKRKISAQIRHGCFDGQANDGLGFRPGCPFQSYGAIQNRIDLLMLNPL